VVLLKQGRLDEALVQYVEAVRREPANPDWHIGLALVLSRRNRREESASELSEAIRLDPENPVARDYLRRIRGAQAGR
jgi:cytochrome c-type biogenesis protein CcmH/NrfG